VGPRGAFEAAEQRSPRVGARSALPRLTRRGCPSGARAARIASSAARREAEQRRAA